MRLEEPPRPVYPTGGEAKRRRVRPSVRRRSSTLQFDTRVCLRLINVMLEMPFIVVFTVSSSVHPQAVRATRPLIAFIAVVVVV